MGPTDSTSLTIGQRSRGLCFIIVHAVLWSMGNALTTGILLYAFASDLDFGRIDTSIIILEAALAGGLCFFFAPLAIHRLGVRLTAIVFQALAGILLITMALAAAIASDDAIGRPLLVLSLGVQQVFQNIAAIAVWEWIARLAPAEIRGRFLGWRETWRLLGIVPVIAGIGWFVGVWQKSPDLTKQEEVWGHAVAIIIGGALQLLSALVLLAIPKAESAPEAEPYRFWWRAGAPLLDRNFFRMLLFACWIAFVAGLMERVFRLYPRDILELSLKTVFGLRIGTLLGQAVIGSTLGRWCDRIGNRPVIMACQLVAGTSLLLYLAASPAQPWWIVAAAIAVVAGIGVQVGLMNLAIKLAPQDRVASYLSYFVALVPIAFAASVVVGEYLYEMLSYGKFLIAGQFLDGYDYTFYIGWAMSMMSLLLLVGLKEPGARSWADLLGVKLWMSRAAEDVAAAAPARHPLD